MSKEASEFVIHALQNNRALCGFPGCPSEWPDEGHKWLSVASCTRDEITCPACKAALELLPADLWKYWRSPTYSDLRALLTALPPERLAELIPSRVSVLLFERMQNHYRERCEKAEARGELIAKYLEKLIDAIEAIDCCLGECFGHKTKSTALEIAQALLREATPSLIEQLSNIPPRGKLTVQIKFLRENFRNDGAEGETVHAVADAAERLAATDISELLREAQTIMYSLQITHGTSDARRAANKRADAWCERAQAIIAQKG